MTKFEELMDIISRKKNNSANYSKASQDDKLEVAGSEDSISPLLECGDDEMDPGLLDQLHRSARPNLMMDLVLLAGTQPWIKLN